jgi:hypothetical protein
MMRPLSESNEQTMKVKLINDMAHLELALSPLSNLSQLGDVYKMLRAFKMLLFTETHLILSSSELEVLPLTVIAHHLFSRFELKNCSRISLSLSLCIMFA